MTIFSTELALWLVTIVWLGTLIMGGVKPFALGLFRSCFGIEKIIAVVEIFFFTTSGLCHLRNNNMSRYRFFLWYCGLKMQTLFMCEKYEITSSHAAMEATIGL